MCNLTYCPRFQRGVLVLLFLLIVFAPTPSIAGSARALPAASARSLAAARYSRLPLAFEINRGQTDARVHFLAHGNGYGLYFTESGVTFSLRNFSGGTASGPQASLAMRVMGAAAHPRIMGAQPMPGKVSYFLGNDPHRWHRGVPTFGKVRYQGLYPGIDLVYYGNQGQLEYDFQLAAHADPRLIRLGFTGARSMRVDHNGDLVLALDGGQLHWRPPVVYQQIGGQRKAVEGRYVLLAKSEVGFALDRYDASHPLVIDPVLVYSTYLGGTDQGACQAICVDGSGNAYVTGYTDALNSFPGAPPLSFPDRVVFVTKMSPGGSSNPDYPTLLYSVFLYGTMTPNLMDATISWQGSGSDSEGTAIAVDGYGNAYVTGTTNATDFSTTANGALTTYPQSQGSSGTLYAASSAFVTAINAAGNGLLYSTFLGGSYTTAGTSTVDVSADNHGSGIAVDSAGEAVVTGSTTALDFHPITAAVQSTLGKDNGASALSNAFVTKFYANGSPAYSTYLGGAECHGYAVALDSAGAAYVTGATTGDLNNATSSYGGDPCDAFVTKLGSSGALSYSVYLGGNGFDAGYGIAVDSFGSAFVTGETNSTNWQLVNPFQSAPATQGTDTAVASAFVTKLSPDGTSKTYSTYLGGSGYNVGSGIALDESGSAYITGYTGIISFDGLFDFPSVGGFACSQGAGPSLDPSSDAFLTEMSFDGTQAVYSTYLAGSNEDRSLGIALDVAGNAYLAGVTDSTDFFVADPLPFPGGAYSGAYDTGFVARIYQYSAVDVAVDNSNITRVLWTDPYGRMTVSGVSDAGVVTPGPTYSAYPYWKPVAISAYPYASGGLTWVLLQGSGPAGALWFWLLDANDQVVGTVVPGISSDPGWTPVDLAIGSDNKARVLWVNNTLREIVVWGVDTSGNVTGGQVIPFNSGWIPSRIAAGTDGMSRVIGTLTTDQSFAAIWLDDNNNILQAGYFYGPVGTGWLATDITVGNDNNKARILWTNSNPYIPNINVWSIDDSTGAPTYGPLYAFAGYTAIATASGNDAFTRVLWNNSDGSVVLWWMYQNSDPTIDNTFAASADVVPY